MWSYLWKNLFTQDCFGYSLAFIGIALPFFRIIILPYYKHGNHFYLLRHYLDSILFYFSWQIPQFCGWIYQVLILLLFFDDIMSEIILQKSYIHIILILPLCRNSLKVLRTFCQRHFFITLFLNKNTWNPSFLLSCSFMSFLCLSFLAKTLRSILNRSEGRHTCINTIFVVFYIYINI